MIKKFYDSIGGNYSDAKSRLMDDSLIKKMILKFPQDDSMSKLRIAIEREDIEESFNGAYTLCGVAGNLSFSALHKASSALTEQLESLDSKADIELVNKVNFEYKTVIDAITTYFA